jgi:DNA helicase-2/ATP-dependent DNA helicase PcrA
MSLSPDQRAAALSPDPRIACLAAPGSGKTRTLVERAAALIRGGAHPTEVLLLTFTRKAAKEMRERCKKLGVRSPEIFTFHGWAARILRQYSDVVGLPPTFTIYGQDDSDDLAIYAGKELGLKAKRADTLLKDPTCYRRVGQLLREAQATDYGGLEDNLRMILERRPELQTRWTHVLVDEGQDTSQAQQELIGMLRPRSLFVVGDPGQSIYGFRGASLEGFMEWGKSSSILTLPTNYRSGRAIVALASRLASEMEPKGLEQVAGDAAADGDVAGLPYAELVEDIRAVTATGASCAVLGSRWTPLDFLAGELEAAGIAHHVARPVRLIWDSGEMRALVAGLQVIHNPHDSFALYRFIRELGPLDIADWSRVRAKSMAAGVSILDAAAGLVPSELVRLADNLSMAQWLDLGNTVKTIASLLREAYLSLHLPNRAEKLPEVVAAILATGLDLEPFLDWYGTRAMDGEEEQPEAPGVVLSSIHGAKGLEWDAVWILGTDRWKQGEEAKRLLYVAATRARARLRMVCDCPEVR